MKTTIEQLLQAIGKAAHVDGHEHSHIGGYTVTIDFESVSDGIAAETAIAAVKNGTLEVTTR